MHTHISTQPCVHEYRHVHSHSHSYPSKLTQQLSCTYLIIAKTARWPLHTWPGCFSRGGRTRTARGACWGPSPWTWRGDSSSGQTPRRCWLALQSATEISGVSHRGPLQLARLLTFNHIMGSWPEWCISSMMYSTDTPLWSGTLDM